MTPDFGAESITEGNIQEWQKQACDSVNPHARTGVQTPTRVLRAYVNAGTSPHTFGRAQMHACVQTQTGDKHNKQVRLFF